MSQQKGFATRAIHLGYDPADHHGALTPPLHLSSTFSFDTAEAGGEVFAGDREGYFYSRVSNPTLDLLEKRIAALEGAEAGLALASGMGAITSTLWTLLRPGDELLVDKTLYGCTFAFMNHGLAKFGVTITHVDMTQPELVSAAISERTKVVSNIAHQHRATVVVDNTYATPYLPRPIAFGADIVVHSATKYLGGHGDLVAGLAVGRADMISEIRLVGMKDMTGAVMAPLNALLVQRGLKTLALRMERHCDTAMEVAEWLSMQPRVASVSYPGLPEFKQFDLAQRQMSRPGGMIAFEMEGGIAAGRALMNRLSMLQRAVSLGDAETLIQHPASMTHSTYTPEERAAHGISDGLVRLSVGLEDAEDILADLKQAMAKKPMAVAV